jgi:tellurium resistance protein TerD
MDYLTKSTPLNGQDGILEVALRWDMKPGYTVDLDVSAICFSDKGVVLDAAYYNQLLALKGAVTHSGDCRRGGKEGCDEHVKLDMNMMENVAVVVFLISAFSGGNLGSCAKASCCVTHNGTHVANMSNDGAQSGDACSLLMCIIFRHPQTKAWRIAEVRKPMSGRHFSACMVGIRHEVDLVIDPAGYFERTLTEDKTFNMHKGELVDIPPNIARLYVGLGWTVADEGIDLDASCIMLTKGANGLLTPYDLSYFSDMVRPGVQHMGDNTTGEGDGDDERILIDLTLLEPQVAALAIVVTIFSPNRTFGEITDSYVRLLDARTGHAYAKYELTQQLTKSAVVFCTITRGATPSDPWTLMTVGEGAVARTGRVLRCNLWDAFYSAAGQRVSTTPAQPMVEPALPALFDTMRLESAPATPLPPSRSAPEPPKVPDEASDECCLPDALPPVPPPTGAPKPKAGENLISVDRP